MSHRSSCSVKRCGQDAVRRIHKQTKGYSQKLWQTVRPAHLPAQIWYVGWVKKRYFKKWGVEICLIPLTKAIVYNSSLLPQLFADCANNSDPSCYFSLPARRWFEARNNCTSKNADLAVLTRSIYLRLHSTVLKVNVGYYIGLRKVWLQWYRSGMAYRLKALAFYTVIWAFPYSIKDICCLLLL